MPIHYSSTGQPKAFLKPSLQHHGLYIWHCARKAFLARKTASYCDLLKRAQRLERFFYVATPDQYRNADYV